MLYIVLCLMLRLFVVFLCITHKFISSFLFSFEYNCYAVVGFLFKQHIHDCAAVRFGAVR